MKKIGLVLIMLVLCSNAVSAWGGKGHALVAEVAFKYMDNKTKQNVLSYLNGMSIQEASVWMDEMRSDPKYDYMKPYHYVNIRKGFPIKEVEGENIIQQNEPKLFQNRLIKLSISFLPLIAFIHSFEIDS